MCRPGRGAALLFILLGGINALVAVAGAWYAPLWQADELGTTTGTTRAAAAVSPGRAKDD